MRKLLLLPLLLALSAPAQAHITTNPTEQSEDNILNNQVENQEEKLEQEESMPPMELPPSIELPPACLKDC